ncbi:uncharacterized protein LOC121968121 [Zingiber officinale]|uniref:uncharacterized protein LOC121968121 n=1 Tax=Zingiber officinale TaxID=94328 RepID=UPI001C4C9FF9|nr:uncharacterized protein LOC121968121 [Zingiber officinale]
MNKVNLTWQFCITSKLSIVILPLLNLTIIWGMLSKTLDMWKRLSTSIGNMMSVAASFYKATLAVTIGISAPFNNLAIIYKQQGNYVEVIACYNEVLRRLLLMVLSIEGTHLRRLVELLKQFSIIYVL